MRDTLSRCSSESLPQWINGLRFDLWRERRNCSRPNADTVFGSLGFRGMMTLTDAADVETWRPAGNCLERWVRQYGSWCCHVNGCVPILKSELSSVFYRISAFCAFVQKLRTPARKVGCGRGLPQHLRVQKQ